MTFELPTLTCQRCGWRWHPRVVERPATCPNPHCRSPRWDKPRPAK